MDTDTRPLWGRKIAYIFPLPQRVILALFGFLAVLNAYTMRICLSLVITRLVVRRNVSSTNSNTEFICPAEITSRDERSDEYNQGTFTWSQTEQGLILSSFYIGYLITHVPGGLLAQRFGAKWVLSLGILLAAIFTMLTPIFLDRVGVKALMALRVCMGMGEGTTFPALAALLSQWVPRSERATFGAFVLGGILVGALVANSVSSTILFRAHWSWVFYTFGTLAIIWFILFTLVCYSDPYSHPFIKITEKEWLSQQMSHLRSRRELPATPWVAMLKSGPMWGLIFGQIGHDWGFYVLATDLPKYMNDVMQFTVRSTGEYSALPFAIMWLVAVFSGPITDILVHFETVGITKMRKINTSIAAFVPSLFLIGASYAGCNKTFVILCFTLCLGFMGPYYSGISLGPLDLSPNYAATVMGISNGLGAFSGMMVPAAIGWMTPNTTIGEWRQIFWVACAFLCLSAIIYNILGSGEVQPWDAPDLINVEAPQPKKS